MIELADTPVLRDPVMIAAFEGWNDAGEAATAVLEHLSRVWGAEPFAALDPEEYYDFQVNRPSVGIDDEDVLGLQAGQRDARVGEDLIGVELLSVQRDLAQVGSIEKIDCALARFGSRPH